MSAYRYRTKAYLRGVDREIRDLGKGLKMPEVPSGWEGYPKAGELVPSLTKWGAYVKVSELGDKPVLVHIVEEWRGKGDPSMGEKPGAIVCVERADGKKVWFIASHTVLYNKLMHLKDKVPFVAAFAKPKGKRYYDMA